MKKIKLGIIGAGGRALHMVRHFMMAGEDYKLAEIEVTAVTDVKSKEECVKYGMSDWFKIDLSNSRFYTDADKMLDTEDLDAVVIGTRCNLHTEMAKKVLKRDMTLFLEKPVAMNLEQILELKEAADKSKSKTVVSFPLRNSVHVLTSKKIIEAGDIGEVAYANAWTRVPYGGTYYHYWYRDESITGGMFVQKSTHDFDYINYLVGKKPVDVCAMKSKVVMKGDKPAGLFCKDCPDNPTCNEGMVVRKRIVMESNEAQMCCFAVDTGNEDSGSAILRYEDGMHLTYSQAFFLRNEASCARGVFLGGSEGSLTFDFHTGIIKVARSYERKTTEIKVDDNGAHFGGDIRLAENFIKVVLGMEESNTPIQQGLDSALLCLKANQSAVEKQFKNIAYEL